MAGLSHAADTSLLGINQPSDAYAKTAVELWQTEPHYWRTTVRREPEFAIVGYPEEHLRWC